ncbi:MAG: sulfatase-like hydrolase/transferase, partial [Rhodobacterales bacterium]|nr:sulfatase-like hydrolase/transferase [Rhodobacterales bacterium]
LIAEGALAWGVVALAVWLLGRFRSNLPWRDGLVALMLLQVGARTFRPSARHAAGDQSGTTIILLTADTLRRDHVSAYPDSVATDLTPNLDALAAIGVRFDAVTAPAPLTLPSHTSYLTGAATWEHGAFRNGRPVPEGQQWFPMVLADAGYRTAAFTSSPVLDRSTGIGDGFQVYRDSPGALVGGRELWLTGLALSVAKRLGVGKSAPAKTPGVYTVNRALAWLAAQPVDASVFLWVHLYDAHEPYAADDSWSGEETHSKLPHPCDYASHPSALRRGPPKAFLPHRKPLPPATPCRTKSWTGSETRVEAYARQVRALDHQVGRFVQGLRDAERWSSTRMVVVADHGESLVEHQALGSHEYWLSEPVVSIPMLVVEGDCPDCVAVRADRVQSERLAATFVAWAGLQASETLRPLSEVLDRDRGALGPAANGRAHANMANLQVSLRDGDLKIIRTEDGYTERYDLRADPRERSPQLDEGDRRWVRAQIADRLKAPKDEHRLPLQRGRRIDELERAALTQEGLFGDEVNNALKPEFDVLIRRADALLKLARDRVDGAAPRRHNDDIRRSLEALGYTE